MWHLKKCFVPLVCCLLFLTPAHALTVSELQERMREANSSISSIRFNYVQEMTSELSREARKSSGKAYVKKPRNLRIEQKEPEDQLVVTSGKNVFVYTPRFNQVLKDSWKRWFSKNSFFPGLVGFDETMSKLKKQYEWKIMGASEINGEQTVNVHLRNSAGQDDQLNLWLGASDFIPRKTEAISGTLKVTTTLISIVYNLDLDSRLFDFQKPPKAEVIQIP